MKPKHLSVCWVFYQVCVGKKIIPVYIKNVKVQSAENMQMDRNAKRVSVYSEDTNVMQYAADDNGHVPCGPKEQDSTSKGRHIHVVIFQLSIDLLFLFAQKIRANKY